MNCESCKNEINDSENTYQYCGCIICEECFDYQTFCHEQANIPRQLYDFCSGMGDVEVGYFMKIIKKSKISGFYEKYPDPAKSFKEEGYNICSAPMDDASGNWTIKSWCEYMEDNNKIWFSSDGDNRDADGVVELDGEYINYECYGWGENPESIIGKIKISDAISIR